MMNLLEDQDDNSNNEQQLDLLNFDNEHNQIPNIDFHSVIVVNEFMNDRVVEIRDGEVVKEGYLSKYKLYVVKTRKHNGDYDTEVSRRFSDFEWLYQELINKYSGYIIPQIPAKHLLTKVNMESFEFSEKRRKELQVFLQRIINHPSLRYVPELRIFIEDKEKFISLLKGELEFNKTIEQKYDNIVSSVKGFFVSQGPLVSRTQDITSLLDGVDKDLSSDESTLIGLSLKCSKLRKICEDYINSLKEEGRTLVDQNEAIIQWNGLGSTKEEDMNQFPILKAANELRQRKINRLKHDIEKKFLKSLQDSIDEIEWALMACKRRRSLQKQLIVDQQRIEELKLQYTDNSSRRDIEMDILKTKYQKNKDRSDKMAMVVTEEIQKFVTDKKQTIKVLLLSFTSLIQQSTQHKLQQAEDSEGSN